MHWYRLQIKWDYKKKKNIAIGGGLHPLCPGDNGQNLLWRHVCLTSNCIKGANAYIFGIILAKMF
jgi:hypothetical protein